MLSVPLASVRNTHLQQPQTAQAEQQEMSDYKWQSHVYCVSFLANVYLSH
jgi:hypothetical protein